MNSQVVTGEAPQHASGRAVPKGRRDREGSEGFVESVRHVLTGFGGYAAHPAAFLLVAIYAFVWYLASPDTFEWHAIATIVTLLIALLIQRSTHRDTQALHAKLDELLRSVPAARAELARLDDEEPEDIEHHRRKEHRQPPA